MALSERLPATDSYIDYVAYTFKNLLGFSESLCDECDGSRFKHHRCIIIYNRKSGSKLSVLKNITVIWLLELFIIWRTATTDRVIVLATLLEKTCSTINFRTFFFCQPTRRGNLKAKTWSSKYGRFMFQNPYWVHNAIEQLRAIRNEATRSGFIHWQISSEPF